MPGLIHFVSPERNAYGDQLERTYQIFVTKLQSTRRSKQCGGSIRRTTGGPHWNPDITKANLTGPIAVGTVFHWETAGMAIPSTIGEVVPLRKLAWSGETGGILGVHVWDFSAPPEGTHVLTEESWEGVSLPAQIEGIQDALDASLVRWLSFLKTRAEALETQIR